MLAGGSFHGVGPEEPRVEGEELDVHSFVKVVVHGTIGIQRPSKESWSEE
jgi:hypothetical protein